MTQQLTLDELLLSAAGATVPDGTGRCYVLDDEVRLPCPVCGGTKWDGLGVNADGVKVPEGCGRCSANGWVPNPDGYAWRRALRAIGGRLNIEIDPRMPAYGDFVAVHVARSRGSVFPTECLRDQLAEMTAICRAIQQMPGVEMGALLKVPS